MGSFEYVAAVVLVKLGETLVFCIFSFFGVLQRVCGCNHNEVLMPRCIRFKQNAPVSLGLYLLLNACALI